MVRHNAPGHFHLLTFSCFEGRPLLRCSDFLALLSESLDRATSRHSFNLSAFVFMPEHVHLLVAPKLESYDISRLLFTVKRPFSYRVREMMESQRDTLLGELMVKERPGKTVFRFWQEGGGHDRNITSPRVALAAAEYIHNNPVRRGLVASPDEWKWSSWRHYHRPDEYDRASLPEVTAPQM